MQTHVNEFFGRHGSDVVVDKTARENKSCSGGGGTEERASEEHWRLGIYR